MNQHKFVQVNVGLMGMGDVRWRCRHCGYWWSGYASNTAVMFCRGRKSTIYGYA